MDKFRVPTREELAWVAGFYEGEGYFGVNGPHCRPTLSIGQAQLEPIERTRAIFGFGGLSSYERPPRKRIWTWRVSNFEHCQAVIAMLWFWLSPRRREQAQLALAKLHDHGSRLYSRRRPSVAPPLRGRAGLLAEMAENYRRLGEVRPES